MATPPHLALVSEPHKQSLAEWIDEIMGEEYNGHKCTRIMLVHCREGEDPREVWVCPVNGKTAADMGTMFDRKSRSYGQELGYLGSGFQLFELWAYYGDAERPDQRHPFIVQSPMRRSGSGTEGPQGHGPEAQRMRQHESIFQAMLGKQAHLDAQHMGLISWLGNSLMNALNENARLARESIAAMRAEQDRSHQYRMDQINAQKSAAFQEKLLSYLPAVVNAAFGKEVFPQGVADTALVVNFIEGLHEKKPEMLAILTQTLQDDPIIGGPLLARIHSIIKEKNDRDEAREKALNAAMSQGPAPEDDAAGGPVMLAITDGKGTK